MKKIFNVKPLEGIEWDNKKIGFSSTREDVELLLGQPEVFENSFYYFENQLRIDFDKDGNVEFIEFLGGAKGTIQPQIYEVMAFEVMADDVFEVFEKKNNGKIDDSENGYSYSFLNLSVGIYRESIPEDIEEDEDNFDCRWVTLGIGKDGYYK